MKKHILLAAVATLTLAPAAYAQSKRTGAAAEQSQLRPADQAFVEKAAIGNIFEVESSELASSRAEGSEVKEFAGQMIRDHGKANKELESAASDLGANVPSELDAKHQQVLTKLEGLEGAQFDRAYIQAQREAHREAVALFSNYSKSGGAVSAWAAETLPTLQGHQRHVQHLGGVAQGESPANMGRSAAEPAR